MSSILFQVVQLRVEFTIADLEMKENIEESFVAEAIQYRVLDKRLTF